LVCACRSGHFDCAVFLLDNGAGGDGDADGEESPLHWLSSIEEGRMMDLTRRLLENGARVERLSGGMRSSLRAVNADWEDCLGIRMTPLGRAVLLKSLPAVRVLLALGANPAFETPGGFSALELAAVLTSPDILKVLLEHLDDSANGQSVHRLDECWMLELAHEGNLPPTFHPVSLHSRLVRCGINYREDLSRTLSLLHQRRQRGQASGVDYPQHTPGKHLCKEISLGNEDIVSCLLDLGHDINGSPGYWPLESAVAANNMTVFQFLIDRGAAIYPHHYQGQTQKSLLQTFASRPRTSPDGIDMARLLIDLGVPLDSHSFQGTGPSPLALAVENGHQSQFQLADLLLSRGAGKAVDDYHKSDPESDMLSLLGRLLTKQTQSTVECLDYLLKNRELLELNLIANQTSNITAIHMLASLPPISINEHSQISEMIFGRVFQLFPDPQSLGEHAVHPKLGTPLTAAVLSGNRVMVTRLLNSPYGADSDLAKPIEILSPFHSGAEFVTLTAHSLAVEAACDDLRNCQQPGAVEPTTHKKNVERVLRRIAIAEDVQRDGLVVPWSLRKFTKVPEDPEAAKDDMISAFRESLTFQAERDSDRISEVIRAAMDRSENGPGHPIDLSDGSLDQVVALSVLA